MNINGKEYTEEQVAAALAAMEAQQAQQNNQQAQQQQTPAAQEKVEEDNASKVKSNIKEGLKLLGVVAATAAATIVCKDVVIPKVFGKSSHDHYYETDDDTIDL